MENLWAPWRIEYVRRAKEKGCIFCDKPTSDNDAASYIIYRGKKNFILLNAYPYNPGHLMVAPYRHIASVELLDDEELTEHARLIRQCLKWLREVFAPDGFNVGMNLGRIAGAGFDQHLHTHIVPRWAGDTNFMPVVGGVGVVNQALEEVYRELMQAVAGSAP